MVMWGLGEAGMEGGNYGDVGARRGRQGGRELG